MFNGLKCILRTVDLIMVNAKSKDAKKYMMVKVCVVEIFHDLYDKFWLISCKIGCFRVNFVWANVD